MAQNEYQWSVRPLTEAMALWDTPDLIFATPQGANWVKGYAHSVNPGTIVIVAERDGKVQFFLPLEVVHKATLAAARFPGGSHANENFAPATRYFCENPPLDIAKDIITAARAARPDIDLIALERLLPSTDGLANPLVVANSTTSPNVALSFKLEKDFATLLAKHNGPKRLKKMRQMDRRMQDRGGWRFMKAGNCDEVNRLLDAFFTLKSARLKEMGVKDVFRDVDVRNFFKDLFGKGLTTHEHEVFGLEVGGDIVAVAGCSVRGSQITAEFGGITAADRQLSPGDILYHKLIEDSCTRGFETFNFGVGDEFYKRRWCDKELWHLDTALPLTLKGSAAALTWRTVASVKRSIKSNQKLFALVKKIRGLNKTAPVESE
jgi:CelD/BcsL family acetyltransferase involved in cellulose biosynthesis